MTGVAVGDLDHRHVIDVIRRATQIAAGSDLGALLERTLDLYIEVAHAEAGTIYLYDRQTDELVFRVVQGDAGSRRLLGTRFAASRGIAGAALRSGQPVFVPDVLG